MIDRQLRGVTERIHQACKRAGRDPKGVKLVLVTKEVAPSRIKLAYDLGVRDFGENKVQDLMAKQGELPKDIRWHFIGSLQTNKVKLLVDQVALIHSCDRLELAKELEEQAAKRNQTVDILIQVNTSREETKHGFDPKFVKQAVSQIVVLGHLKVRGLMTMGPNTQDQERIRQSFRALRSLKDQLQQEFPNGEWHYLSMGMSFDFELAIEEGANLLRIGTAVFGERTK